MASAYTTPIHRFSFRVEYQALCHLQQAYYIHLLQPLPASNIIILQASITHNISHHLVKCCNFLHIMSVIQWCHQLGTFFDKIVSICVQYQGYLDPDIIGLFCHDYIICTTQTRRYTADPSYHYKYISFGVHMISTYQYQSMGIGKEIVDIIQSTFEHIHT